MIEDSENQPLLSMAGLWEMAIKVSIGTLKLSLPFEEWVAQQMELNGIDELDIRTEHIAQAVQMPFHPRDPFDWLPIAQAKVEGMPIVGADPAFDACTVTWMR